MRQWFKRQRHWLCLALFGARQARLRPFLPMRDEPGCDVPIKVALAVATLQFRKVCAFVTISSHRPCLSSSTRAARLHCPPPSPFVAEARGPESLSGLSKSERGVRTSLSYDRISRLRHRRRSGLSGLGPETHDPLSRPGSLNALRPVFRAVRFQPDGFRSRPDNPTTPSNPDEWP